MHKTEKDVKADHGFTVSVGNSRKSKKWSIKNYMWNDFLADLRSPTRTRETSEEYKGMTKDEQVESKDVGGFVGGVLKKGMRKKGHVAWRHLITIDVDHADRDFWDMIEFMFSFECCLYSTHSHTPESPKYRLVIPLKNPVPAEEYEPLSRMVSDAVGLDYIDHTTHQSHRLMFWPSVSSDAEYTFKSQRGRLLDPKEWLGKYAERGLNWEDPFHWPKHESEQVHMDRNIKKVGDPLTKPGLIGAFNRAYDIHQAIAGFIPDVYDKVEDERYTYLDGSAYGGLIVYGDGTLAYSHHESDPCGQMLSNAFDLIRLHKFGAEDLDAPDSTSIASMPSYKAMKAFVSEDPVVRKQLAVEQLGKAKMDFSEVDVEEEEDLDWLGDLSRNKQGQLTQSIGNALIILRNDSRINGTIGMNEFNFRPSIIKSVPWRKLEKKDFENNWTDSDLSYLHAFMEGYGLKSTVKINTALDIILQENSSHPVREYINKQSWDGEKRIETLFHDYLGVKNTEYAQLITKKSLVACVKRVFQPGCKHDNMIVLIGPQGIGKSTILDKLAHQWFSDTLDSMKGKDSYGQLAGNWIIELAELTATRKSDVEEVKHFISKRIDDYRKSYDRYESSVPRQCIFFGTTNDHDFLVDKTGNRRFLPLTTGDAKPKLSVFKDLTPAVVDQMWAEAKTYYDAGYPIHLEGRAKQLAQQAQSDHTMEDPLEVIIAEYIERAVPADWEGKERATRESFDPKAVMAQEELTAKPSMIHSHLVWTELLNRRQADMTRYDSKKINDIIAKLCPDWARAHITIEGYNRQRGFRR